MGGSIVNLPIGNTEVIAKKIQGLTGSDLFQIQTVKSYPEDYTETTKVSQDELSQNARPELAKMVADMDSYDVIYLGYPNWWGTMPMAVFTFLDSYDFSVKTIVPYCTHGWSVLNRNRSWLHAGMMVGFSRNMHLYAKTPSSICCTAFF